MRELWKMFLVFLRIGGFTFGGGYAMLPMLQREMVDKYHWTTEEELINYYAVGQCTPGIIALNVATFVGYRRKGFLGALMCSIGVVLPSVVIITIIAALVTGFADNVWMQHALAGIRVVVCVLVLNTVIKMTKTGVKDALCAIIFCAALALMVVFSPSPVIVVAVAGVIGALFYGRKQQVKSE